jgi:hypothetical protein
MILLGLMAAVTLMCTAAGSLPSSPSQSAEIAFDYEGVTYQFKQKQEPRPLAVHIVRIDLRADGIRTFVTPADQDGSLPLDARTTSQVLTGFGLQIAINGDGFTPWHDYGFLGYRPHSGDGVDVLGYAAAEGQAYSEPRDQVPTLYFTRTGRAVFNQPPSNVFQAISGLETIVQAGLISSGLESDPEPRTAVGLNRSGRTLILIIVDGRQSGYSEGATVRELAQLMLDEGAHNAMNMDGGGSTTLVVAGTDGQAVVINSPVHQGVVGRERPVANHLGIYAHRR